MPIQNSDLTQWAGTSAGVTAGLFLLVRWVFRRVSRDSVEVVKDRAEADVISTLQLQLAAAIKRVDELSQRADQFAKERNEAVAELHCLRREVLLLRSQVQHQSGLLSKLVNTLWGEQQLEQILQAAGIDLAALPGILFDAVASNGHQAGVGNK